MDVTEAPGGCGQENYDSLPDSHSFDTKCSLNVQRRREPLGASANKPDKGKEEQQQQQQQTAEGDSQQQQQRQHMVRPSVEIIIPNEIGEIRNGFQCRDSRAKLPIWRNDFVFI
jgi:hypothetical protein